jgi:hypothetical protein
MLLRFPLHQTLASGTYQSAEIRRIAFGLGIFLSDVRPWLRVAVSVTASIGLRWPKKSPGSIFAVMTVFLLRVPFCYRGRST